MNDMQYNLAVVPTAAIFCHTSATPPPRTSRVVSPPPTPPTSLVKNTCDGGLDLMIHVKLHTAHAIQHSTVAALVT